MRMYQLVWDDENVSTSMRWKEWPLVSDKINMTTSMRQSEYAH